MANTPKNEISIYEETFAKSEDTDAILVVEGKKLHVNKALLSIHSPYFKTLFNSDFKEKSMEEIPIEDVKFEEFATLLSLVQDNPLPIKKEEIENLFKIADRFMLNNPKRQLERFVIHSKEIPNFTKILLADEYKLNYLLEDTMKSYDSKDKFHDFYHNTKWLSSDVKLKLFDKYFENYNLCH